MEAGFEYIDHPADIQLHSWGANLSRALEPLCVALSGVMFDPSGFNDNVEKEIEIESNDLFSLVCQLLEEFLFLFDTTDFVLKRITITDCDLNKFKIKATAYGDEYDPDKHSDFQRTEVKAITYASMQVEQKEDKTEIYVIIDL